MSYSVLPPATSCLICCSRNSYCEASILTAIPVSVANFSVSAVSVGTCGHAGAKMLMVEFCATVCPGRITDGMASAAAAAEVVFTRVRRVIVTERNCSRSKPVLSRSGFDIEPSSSARYLHFARTLVHARLSGSRNDLHPNLQGVTGHVRSEWG